MYYQVFGEQHRANELPNETFERKSPKLATLEEAKATVRQYNKERNQFLRQHGYERDSHAYILVIGTLNEIVQQFPKAEFGSSVSLAGKTFSKALKTKVVYAYEDNEINLFGEYF